jgi:hypothetical protein
MPNPTRGRLPTPKTLDDFRARSSWFGLVPHSVAEQQVAWERRESVTRMRNLGYSINAIAAQWGISPGIAAYLLRHHATSSGARMPIARWLADDTDFLVLAKLVRRTAMEESLRVEVATQSSSPASSIVAY